MSAIVEVTLAKADDSYAVSVKPWSVVVHKTREPREIEWIVDDEMVEVLMIQFQRGGHFQNSNPIGTRWTEPARSGPVAKSAAPGTYKYSILVSPRPNRLLVIDPDYMIEED